MRIFWSALLAASAIGVTSVGASAAPIGPLILPGEVGAQTVAVVCDRSGRCYETNRRHAKTDAPRARSRDRNRNSRDAYRQGYSGDRYGHQRSPEIEIGVGPFGFGINTR